jgi:hypothetical protein
MVRRNFQARNIGGDTGRPIIMSDDSQRILQQADQYIKGLQEVRDLESQYMAQYISEYDQKLTKENQWSTSVKESRIRQASAISDQYVAQLQRQQRAIESITGRKGSVTGDDPTVDDWVEFVAGVSKTAAETIADVREKRKEASWNQAVLKAQLFGMNPNTVAWKRSWRHADIMSSNQQAFAAAAEAAGMDESQVEYLRSMDDHALKATKWYMSVQLGNDATTAFQEALTENSDLLIEIPDKEGNLAEIPLNQIDQTDRQQLNSAWAKFLPDYYRKNGYGDASVEFLQESLTKAKSGFDNFIGQKRQEEIIANNVNRIDSAKQGFLTMKDPDSWHRYYQTLFFHNKGDHAATRAEAFKILNDPFAISEEQLDAIKDTSFKDQENKPLGARYAAEFEAIDAERQNAIDNQYKALRQSKQIQELKLIDSFVESRAKDMIDGKVDKSGEDLKSLALQARAQNMDKLAEEIESTISYTADSLREEAYEQLWNEQTLYGTLDATTIMKTSGVSVEFKQKWLAKAKESNRSIAPSSLVKEFESYASDKINERVGYFPSMQKAKSPTIGLAKKKAVREWKADFKVGMQQFNDQQRAADYANGRFEQRFGTDETKGSYRVLGIERDPKTGKITYTDVDQMGRYDLTVEPVNPITSPLTSIAKTLQTKGASAYREQLVPKEQLEAVVKQYRQTGQFKLPPSVQFIADQSGGTLSSFRALQLQLAAHNLEPIPEEISNQVTALESSVNALYDPFVRRLANYKPSPTRTDIMVMNAGQKAVYEPISPIQSQAWDIIKKYEVGGLGSDAINRGGTNQGRTAIGIGKIQDILGKPMNEVTVRELLELGQNKEVFAAGPAQFIPSTFAEQVKNQNIPLDAKLTDDLWKYMTFVYGKKVGWRGIWIGPTDKADPREAAILDAAFAEPIPNKPVWRQPANMNPNLNR